MSSALREFRPAEVIGADDDASGGKRKTNAAEGRDASIYESAIRFIENHRSEPFYVNVWGHVQHHPVNP